MSYQSIVIRHIKGGFILLKSQLLSSVTCFILYLLAFFFLKKNTAGYVIYSIFSMLTTFLFIYADSFKIAENDLKTYHQYEHYPLKGAILSLIPLLITTVIIVAWQLVYIPSFQTLTHQSALASSIFLVIQFVFVGYTFPYQGFMQLDENHIRLISYFLIYIVPFFTATVGYYAGTQNFSFYNKLIFPLIYKKKK